MGFLFVSGNLGLDFAGTVGARRDRRVELLPSPADLARWTVEAGLLDTAPPATPADLTTAVALREAIYALATQARTNTPLDRETLQILNTAAEAPPPTVRLTPPGLAQSGSITNALSAVARATITLLGGPDTTRLRECEAETCTRLFIDASRHKARRWCDMRRCGNRAKAATYRTRHTP
ncbi:CGNR zinc finger [Actinomadura rubteroloni]|uniref:CGNR zinc finger n=1 Tax=Actinomadura rubteroloni TaxID=1926885 RepID=A0A2P4UKI7_9ACTN|nr:ABATE domain-containing protein [Actinomadura rubteroloni]POM25509.1 CGNR zinc finger [Actinomadura rubteroloni]